MLLCGSFEVGEGDGERRGDAEGGAGEGEGPLGGGAGEDEDLVAGSEDEQFAGEVVGAGAGAGDGTDVKDGVLEAGKGEGNGGNTEEMVWGCHGYLVIGRSNPLGDQEEGNRKPRTNVEVGAGRGSLAVGEHPNTP